MRRLRAFAGFWWDFLVGDDWRLALGVLVALAATIALAHAGLTVWWLLPGAVAVLLAGSLLRAIRSSD